MDPGILAIVGAVAGSAITFGGNLAGAFVRDSLARKRERRMRALAGIDAAVTAMEGIGERAQQALISPPFWPSLKAVHPARQFAYEVAGAVQDPDAVDAYLSALAAVFNANSSLVRSWAFRLSKFGLDERLAIARRLSDAEAKVIAAAVKRRESVE